RFQTRRIVRLTEATRVSELKPKHEIFGGPGSFAVGSQKNLLQLRQATDVGGRDDELARIGPSIGAHGHGFTPADELGSAFAETLPAAAHIIRYAPLRCAIPSFHGLNSDTVAQAFAIDPHVSNRLGQRRFCTHDKMLVAGKINSKRGAMPRKFGNAL